MTIEAQIARLTGFYRATEEYSKSLGKAAGSAPRRAAFFLCDSLRSATKIAPKKPRTSEIEVLRDGGPYQIITYRRKQPLPWPLARWRVRRLVRDKEYIRYLYADYRKGKPCHSSPAAARREVIETTPLKRAGLAKLSWSWVKHNIWAGKAPDAPWLRENKARNPKKACAESRFRVTSTGSEALVSNRLDYIVPSLRNGAASLNDSLSKTAKRLNYLAESAADRTAVKLMRGLV